MTATESAMRTSSTPVAQATASVSTRIALLREFALVCVAFGALCAAAQVRVPVPGSLVPMTLQSLAVLLIGLTLPAGTAFSATAAYIVGGTLGLPILVSPAGLWGVTGGYLAGFALAAPLMAGLRGSCGLRGVTYVRLLTVSLAGLLVIFVCGVTWQRVGFVGSWGAALGVGFVPFVGKALIEALLAAGLVRVARFEPK